MVLVDTSVWIRGLRGDATYQEELARLLSEEQVASHPFIYGELLMGDKGGRVSLLESYSLLPELPTVVHNEIVQFARHHHLHGRGVGWIDLHLLASTLLSGHFLWTADPRLETMAQEFRLAYVQPGNQTGGASA